MIPAIDLSCFVPGAKGFDDAARATVAAELDKAASEIGFFHVKVPGLSEAADRLLARTKELHALPEKSKRAMASHLSPMYRGWTCTWCGEGASCSSKIGVDPPDPKETFMLGSEGEGISPMHGPNQWPSEQELPGWEESVKKDWATMLSGAKALAYALAAALGEPPTAFEEAIREPATVLVMLRYDPARLVGDSSVGCGSHTDCGFLTLLAQQPNSAPVQVQRGALGAGTATEAGVAADLVDDHAWVEAKPLPGHVLVNLGDMVERWTNGRYRSTVHRVVLDRSVAEPRHSTAFFCNPTFETEVACFPTCCAPTPGMPEAKYEAITAGKYICGRLGLMYESNS